MASSSNAAQNQTLPENAFDQLTPSSSSASASASASDKLPYDIFINHRGCDMKRGFASTIYHTLDLLQVRAFLDQEALELGDGIPLEIQAAMANASLHIAIFSPNYAQSPWCLAELSFMLKTGTKIIPIFYNVDPSDLRWIDQGIYAPSFSEHEKKGRYTQEKLEEWRKALNNISFHTGYIIKDNEDEGMRLKSIVNCLLRHLLNKRIPLEVAKHSVGLDELVQEFESATVESAQSQQNVQIAGIVGMGGSGKTTLAKELFNKKSMCFDRCSFVSDVRDAAARNVLHTKQEKLLTDFGVHSLPLDNIDQGKEFLKTCLRSLRVLIVLDDVDHIEQLVSLLPNINNLGSDSLVIVTTRDLGVLISWNVSSIYKMPGLNELHARHLFCRHALLQSNPPSEFKSLVDKFLTACNGLPLSLKVLGAQLYGKKSKDYWVSQLDKISRLLPADIKQRLQLSYNVLDEEEKEIFLDVACFLIGEEKSLAIAVWDGSGWSGLHSLETLVNKCLVELDEKNKIRMHDHLRDMGREIAATHSPVRLWLPEYIFNMKKYFLARTPIRGIGGWNSVQAGNSRRGFKRFRSSHGLELLHVDLNQFKEELASLSEELVWLRWSLLERKIPSWLSLRNISVLELYGRLEELWDDNVQPPLKLRELRIGGISNVLQRFPCSIGRLKHLKKIILENGFGGSSLPEEFCGLQSLEHLALPWSKILSSLPARFGDLTNLCHIDLSDCERMQMLPNSFKQLIRLQYLDLFRCKTLKLRLDMLENITKLQYLNFNNCKELEELPRQITKQGSLKELRAWGCLKLRDLPTDIGKMCRLEKLSIMFCPLLTSLPSSLGQMCRLETLSIVDCPLLTSLPSSLGQMCRLETLTIEFCPLLTSLPSSFGELSSLTTLQIRKHALLNHSLLEKCGKLTSLPICFGNMPSLTTLLIIRCESLTSLPSSLDERNFTSLKKFILRHCPKIEKIEGLEQCRSLKELAVETSWEVAGIQSLQNVERLDVLELSTNTISALKPCIQSLKECPLRMELKGRAIHVVKPIVNSLEFPDLTIIETVENMSDVEKIKTDWESLLCYAEKEESNGEGKEVHIAVFRKPNEWNFLRMFFRDICDMYGYFKDYKLAIVKGGDVRVVKAFNKLLALVE